MPVNSLEEAEAFLAECKHRLHASRTKRGEAGARGRYGRALDTLIKDVTEAFIVLPTVFHKTTFSNTQMRFDQVCEERNLDANRYRMYEHIDGTWLLIDWEYLPPNNSTPDLETQFEAWVLDHSAPAKQDVSKITNAAIKLDKAASK